MVDVKWKANQDGQERHALYYGGICVGQIATWSGVDHPQCGKTRAWFFSNEDMPHVGGWFDTADEARDAVEKELRKAAAPF